jgi:hypothetical protein
MRQVVSQLLACTREQLLELPCISLYPCSSPDARAVVSHLLGTEYASLTFEAQSVPVLALYGDTKVQKPVLVQRAFARNGSLAVKVTQELCNEWQYLTGVMEVVKDLAATRQVTMCRRVVVIEDAGLLTSHVQRALHKVIESTLATAMFVLVCRQPNGLGASLVSSSILVNCSLSELPPRVPGLDPSLLDSYTQSARSVKKKGTKAAQRAHAKNHRALMAALTPMQTRDVTLAMSAWLAAVGADVETTAVGLVAGMVESDSVEVQMSRSSSCLQPAARSLAVRHILAVLYELA